MSPAPRSKFTGRDPHDPYGDWKRNPASDPNRKHTFYVVLRVEGSARGIAYDFEEIDADAPDQYATLALLRETRDGRLEPMTYEHFNRNFDQLLEDAVNRAGVFPKNGDNIRDSISSIFRHKNQ